MWTWPADYWSEFLKYLVDDGHEVFVFTDEDHVNINIKHEKVHKCFGLDEQQAEEIVSKCDVYVGVPLHFCTVAEKHGLKTLRILGATLEGEGVKATVPCAGCLDKLDSPVDCSFADELCYLEITPYWLKEEFDKIAC